MDISFLSVRVNKVVKKWLLCVFMANITLFIIFVPISTAFARWYAGYGRLPVVDGVTALISTPQTPLDLIDLPGYLTSGVSNWVSSHYADQYGSDWIQAGWKYYYEYTLPVPKQYIEIMFNWDGENYSTHIMLDEFAVQYFGTTVDYWVSREPGNNWCGITAGAVRYCIENFHLDSVPVYVESEVHGTTLNPMDSTFNEVRYKDPDNGVWRLFDDQVIWIEQFPYTYEAYSYSHFRTYRVNTHENIYIPIGFK